ncbi:MAG: hypothetical protein FP826_02215 [Sphingomonadales bacterium]|nr:hypothetical protein [Sphingomonadales bacterium]MBU3992568.1 hypothetical protein [Alphaproteobacteria bacterium]
MMALNTNTPYPRMVQSAGANEADYRAFRKARAIWELITAAGDEVAAEPLFEAYADSIDTYLLAPASNAAELARKLRVVRDEELWRGWNMGQEIFSVLAEDARIIALADVAA